MSRHILALAALLGTSLPLVSVPAAAAPRSEASQPDAEGRCANQESRRRRGRILGGIGGGLLRQAVPGAGYVGFIPAEEILSEAITAMLDCRERQQAVEATNEAVRGGVGTTVTWTSETRPGVSGSSVVTAQTREANGGDCMTVTDIIIVNGEESRAPKTLCKRPPSQRYVRV
jgi:surface antigen